MESLVYVDALVRSNPLCSEEGTPVVAAAQGTVQTRRTVFSLSNLKNRRRKDRNPRFLDSWLTAGMGETSRAGGESRPFLL